MRSVRWEEMRWDERRVRVIRDLAVSTFYQHPADHGTIPGPGDKMTTSAARGCRVEWSCAAGRSPTHGSGPTAIESGCGSWFFWSVVYLHAMREWGLCVPHCHIVVVAMHQKHVTIHSFILSRLSSDSAHNGVHRRHRNKSRDKRNQIPTTPAMCATLTQSVVISTT